MSAPASLKSVVSSVLDQLKVKQQLPELYRVIWLTDAPEQNVFCTESLLRDAVTELIVNIDKHVSQRAVLTTIWIEVEKHEGKTTLIIRNDNTEVKDTGGRGLQRLERRLLPFQARLDPEPRPNDGISTYRVAITFLDGE
jgi:hypothetical protein